MGQPVVHFEIIGADPESLRAYYGELFGWEFDSSSPVSDVISEPNGYGFVQHDARSDGIGIPGGIGGGSSYDTHTIFYVGVPDVEAALQRAEHIGGTDRTTVQLVAAELIGVARRPPKTSHHQAITCRRCSSLTPPGNTGESSSSASTRS